MTGKKVEQDIFFQNNKIVYQGIQLVAPTIHYSLYRLDNSIVDLKYFGCFVKTPTFIKTIEK